MGVDDLAEVRQVRPASVVPGHLDGVEGSGEGEDLIDGGCRSRRRWVLSSFTDLVLRQSAVQSFQVENRDIESVARLFQLPGVVDDLDDIDCCGELYNELLCFTGEGW